MSSIVKKVNSDRRLAKVAFDAKDVLRLHGQSEPVLTTPATPTMGVTFIAGAAFTYNIVTG